MAFLFFRLFTMLKILFGVIGAKLKEFKYEPVNAYGNS